MTAADPDELHQFVGRREWGINDTNPQHECQRCGVIRARHPVVLQRPNLSVVDMEKALRREFTTWSEASLAIFPERRYDPERVHELLTLLTCPGVCRGYLDGGENWHQLCLDTATEAMKVLELTLPPDRLK